MLTLLGTIAINIYIYAQCVVLIAGEKFVSVGEFRPRSLSLSLSLSWLEGLVQSDIHSVVIEWMFWRLSFFAFNDTKFLAAD